MRKSIICNCILAYFMQGAVGGEDRQDKRVIFKSYMLFTNYVSETDNANVDNADILDVVMPAYNLLEHK